jgi:uncharacterized membrane protein
MYHNDSFWRFGFGGGLWGGIGVLVVIAAVVLVVVLLIKKNRDDKTAQQECNVQDDTQHTQSADPHGRIMEILRVQCEARQTNAADYEERRMVLDSGKLDDYQNAELITLKERYARLEIPTQEYVEARNKILNLS